MTSKIHEFHKISRISTKLVLLFVLASTLFSCSSDDTAASPKIIRKVVFYHNSPNERQWNISNDLLTTITLADGTVIEEFVYDSSNRVVKDIKYTNGAVASTSDITYNDDNTIKTIDGLPYTFNASSQTYAYSYGSNFTIHCQVNADKLAVDFVRTGVGAAEYQMTYDNGDMTSFKKTNNGTTEILKNFQFDAEFGSNPIFNAVIPVARVKSLTDPSFFVDCQASRNMANGFDKGAADPFYYNYGLVPSHKLSQIGVEVLDSNNNFVEFYSFADYHYQ